MKTSTIRPSRPRVATIVQPAKPDSKLAHPGLAANVLELTPEKPAALSRLLVGPLDGTGEMIDVTQQVVGIIAQEIWKRSQGNDLLNWIEAERLFQKAMQEPAAARPGGLRRHGR